jgi:uncharacterized protein (TIGR03067 family)
MKHIIVAAIVIGVAASLAAADEKDLNGTWIAVSATNAGEKVTDDLVKDGSIVFENGRYTASLGEIVDKGKFKTDQSKKPNTIDLISDNPPKKGKGRKGGPQLGAFELDRDTLTINFNPLSDKRPTDLTSTAENMNFVVVYKRKK